MQQPYSRLPAPIARPIVSRIVRPPKPRALPAPAGGWLPVLAKAVDEALALGADAGAVRAGLEQLLAKSRPMPAGAAGRVSPRQREVLRLVAAGRSNKQIALSLGVSPATIKTHVATALTAIGARNRTEAAMIARERGWI